MRHNCPPSFRWRSSFTALLAIVVSGCLHGPRAVAPPPDSIIRLTEVFCYVACDSLTAEFRSDGALIRAERGAVIGSARQKIPRNGADTVSIFPTDLDSLRAGLADLTIRGLAMEYRQGRPPCIPLMTTHTPVVTIEWTDRDGPARVKYDFGCHEPSGRVEAVSLLALRLGRFRAFPVTPR